MANCPNCGAELAPSVLSCARCRMPLPPTHPGSGLWDRPGSGLWQDPARPAAGPQPGSSAQPPQTPSGQTGGPTHQHLYAQQFSPNQQFTPPPASPPTDGLTLPPDPEDERARRSRRNTITMISLAAVVLLIALVSGIVIAVSSLSPQETAGSAVPQAPSTAPLTDGPPPPDPTPPATEGPPTSAQPTTPAPTTPAPEKGPTTTAKDTNWCTARVGVPKTGTTCEFAEQVAAAVAKADPEAEEFTVDARSPVTKKDYTMSCVRNSVLITCTGGNNATVWIKVGE